MHRCFRFFHTGKHHLKLLSQQHSLLDAVLGIMHARTVPLLKTHESKISARTGAQSAVQVFLNGDEVFQTFGHFSSLDIQVPSVQPNASPWIPIVVRLADTRKMNTRGK